MKKIIVLAHLILFPFLIIAQDFDGPRPAGSHASGVNIANYYNTNIQLTAHTHSGSHGILFNAYKPSSTVSGGLGATGNTKYAHDVLQYGGGAGAIMFYGNGGTIDFLVSPGSTGAGTDINWGVPKMRIKRNGNVGIGVTNPYSSLHISSSTIPESSTSTHDAHLLIQGTGNRDLNTGVVLGFSLPANVDGSNPWQHGRIMVSPDNPNSGRADGKMLLQTRYYNGSWDWRNNLVLLSSGDVGIGTTDTFGYKLAVNGKIGTKEVNVEVSSDWPDFVFKKDYPLPTLEQVETHIKENGHLKDIPSEAEVKANGINLGEMDAKLLQKIEELTLYTIAQEKLLSAQAEQLNNQKQAFETQLSQQQEKIQKLEKENEVLKSFSKRLAALEKQLKTKNL